MGGILTGPKTLWSPEELAEIERVTEMYKFALDYITKEVYNGIPFRSGKKSEDPTSTMWAEPLTPSEERGGPSGEDENFSNVR
jgi:hypothetical protein